MAVTQSQRQSQLFPTAENWQTLYTAFTQVNFNAYDFDTIKSAMIDYINMNYPEEFNDWTENSELVMLIELLAYLGTSIAFRMDLNTRENFIDTATRRESIFRLARLLSYQPQRCIPASGLLKITQIACNQDIYDSSGNNLNGQTILWNDANNEDWQEQFSLVLNATLNSTNQIGNPSKSGYISNNLIELYEMNNMQIPSSVIPFQSSINGNSMMFDVVNPDFTPQDSSVVSVLSSSGTFFEKTPNPTNSWNIIYMNDGNGFGSSDTGYFMMFKQGSLSYTDYQLDQAIPNRVIDVNVDNVNNSDVYVLSINQSGQVVTTWTPVPSVNGFSTIYNSINSQLRNIFSVYTRDSDGNDQISIRFADGNFGNVPTGLLRVWYRVSNNLTYQIRPTDLSNIIFSLAYADNDGNQFTVNLTTSLQKTITNAQASQTNSQIKLAAGQVYYTQDRMVNGEDYNLFPMMSSEAIKVKAVNRYYSGQSAYFDINDPTGTYQDTILIGDDGIVYREMGMNSQSVLITTSISSGVLISNYIQPIMSGTSSTDPTFIQLRDFYYSNYGYQNISANWSLVSYSGSNCSGFFKINNVPAVIGNKTVSSLQYINQGSVIGFNVNNQTVWATVISVQNNGIGVKNSGLTADGYGAVVLDTYIPANSQALFCFPTFRTTLTSSEYSNIQKALAAKQTFGLGFNNLTQSWYIITNGNLSNNTNFSSSNSQNTSNTNLDASWLLKIEYSNNEWIIYSRSLKYIIESANEIRFFSSNSDKVQDLTTGLTVYDTINILGINQSPDSQSALGADLIWMINGQTVYNDGYPDPTSVMVSFNSKNSLNTPANPMAFEQLVNESTNQIEKLVFWNQYVTLDGYEYYSPVTILPNHLYQNPNDINLNDNSWAIGDYCYVLSTNKVFQYNVNNLQIGYLVDVTDNFKIATGRNNLKFIWKHYASSTQRIDPAVSNMIDIFVLTNSYDTAIRNWIYTSSQKAKPLPPTTDELRTIFADLENYKVMSDQIIWNPAQYKLLFGSQSDPNYQATFKVVPVSGTTITNNEIKAKVINEINNYFKLQNWDFGQTFYFTELAAYIHSKLATIVGSIVMVPNSTSAQFGDLFEIPANPNEICISCATVSDVEIVNSISNYVLS